MNETFGLAEVIKTLRKDITKAVRNGEGHDIQFTLNNIEIELQTVIEKSINGGIEFKVFGNGAEISGDAKKIKTHMIKLNVSVTSKEATKKGLKTVKLSNKIKK